MCGGVFRNDVNIFRIYIYSCALGCLYGKDKIQHTSLSSRVRQTYDLLDDLPLPKNMCFNIVLHRLAHARTVSYLSINFRPFDQQNTPKTEISIQMRDKDIHYLE